MSTKKNILQKRYKVQTGIWRNTDGTYDVRVSRRIKLKDGEPTKQFFKHRRSINGEGNAIKIRRELYDDLARLSQKHEGKDLLWKDALDIYIKYLENRLNDERITHATFYSTKKTLEKHTQHWNKKWLSEFTSDFIESFISSDKLKDALQSETRVSILKYIRAVFKRMISIGKMQHNPAAGIYIKGRKKLNYPIVMTKDQITNLISYAEKADPQWGEVYKVAYLTGARSGELWALKWSNVDLENKVIHITHSYDWKTEKEKSTKGKKDRTIPINNDLLKCLIQIRNKYGDYVLARIPDWKSGKSARTIRAFQKELGITPTRFHSIRAAFITHLLLEGVPIVKLQSLAGHEDLRTSLLYFSMIGEDIKGTTDTLTLTPKTKGA